MTLCSGLHAVLEWCNSMIGTLKKSNLIRGEKSEARAVISKEAAVSLSRVGMGIGEIWPFLCFGQRSCLFWQDDRES